MKNKIFNYYSPTGELEIGVSGKRIVLLDWKTSRRHVKNILRINQLLNVPETHVKNRICRELDLYFSGKSREVRIETLIIGTDFEKLVWEGIQKIPYGETVTYGKLAGNIGCPTSVRAVANAVGRNPLSVIIPCHRIVAARNMPGGYAGGIEAKRFLLDLENRL